MLAELKIYTQHKIIKKHKITFLGGQISSVLISLFEHRTNSKLKLKEN